jgi:hypothetical protein
MKTRIWCFALVVALGACGPLRGGEGVTRDHGDTARRSDVLCEMYLDFVRDDLETILSIREEYAESPLVAGFMAQWVTDMAQPNLVGARAYCLGE